MVFSKKVDVQPDLEPGFEKVSRADLNYCVMIRILSNYSKPDQGCRQKSKQSRLEVRVIRVLGTGPYS